MMKLQLIRRTWTRLCIAAVALALIVMPREAYAYPEFQKYSQTNSGKAVSCAMCHAHPDGPEGVAAGQIGGLNTEALALLNEARGAFEPGKKVASPILNDFGNELIHKLGKKKIIELKRTPEKLAEALGASGDMDHDGVPDSREYVEGTHPLHATSGNPLLLFASNLRVYWFNILMITLATVAGLFGFHHIKLGLEMRSTIYDDQELTVDGDEDDYDPTPQARSHDFERESALKPRLTGAVSPDSSLAMGQEGFSEP